MADQWDTYITRAQSEDSTLQPRNPFADIPILGQLFGALGGRSSNGGIQADRRGMFTPSMLPMPVGPPSPINHLAIRNLLNSGVLRTGQMPGDPPPPPSPEPETPAPKPRTGLLSFLFGGM